MGISNWGTCLLLIIAFSSCTVNKQVSKAATTILLKDTAVATGHIGICIYEPATNKYWYNYNATNYFIPASNTKLFTLYAGMKYLGDSLVAARVLNSNSTIFYIYPSGDPTFLNPEFTYQPLFNYLKSFKNTVGINDNTWDACHWEMAGHGMIIHESYMAERSSFPIYNNLIEFSLKNYEIKNSVVQFKCDGLLPSK